MLEDDEALGSRWALGLVLGRRGCYFNVPDGAE